MYFYFNIYNTINFIKQRLIRCIFDIHRYFSIINISKQTFINNTFVSNISLQKSLKETLLIIKYPQKAPFGIKNASKSKICIPNNIFYVINLRNMVNL